MEVAGGNKYRRHEPPFNIIYFAQHLTSLCEAEFTLNKQMNNVTIKFS